MNRKNILRHIKFLLYLIVVPSSLVLGQNELQIFSPNGGENWRVNSQETIQWLSNNGPNRINIEYTTDGGTNWMYIATNIVNPVSGSGQYVWTIPNTPSTDCLVKISDAVDGIPFDTSDAPFTISQIPRLDLISPNGGENWRVGVPQTIQWSSVVGNDPQNVKLEYSINGGVSWIVINASTPNSGQYAWTPPGPASTSCLMMVSDAVDGVPSDTSDSPFTISPAPGLTVSGPNGGEVWVVGTSQAILWESVISNDPANVKLEYSVDNGNNWLEIVANTPNDGDHAWTIPNNPSVNCRVRISDAVDGNPSDISDNIFEIQPAPAITVTSPASGDSWLVGSTVQINWSTEGNVGNVEIFLSRDNGSTYEILYSDTPDDGSQSWTVQMPRSDNCLIRVAAMQSAAVAGLSSLFSIVPQTVSSLIRGEPQVSGSTQSAYRLFSVPLQLQNGSPEDVLADDLGTYDKTIWRFFDYQNGEYVEYSDTRDFSPGRSFFLIVRDTGKVIDTGSGTLVADSVIAVSLSAGWNFIANPFNFDIPITALSVHDNLITYNGSWTTPGAITELSPWEGYALRVESATTLSIRFPGQSGAPLPKISRMGEKDWQIHIIACCQNARDDGNFAGVIQGASDLWDRFDYYEPPEIGEFVKVYFPHPDWNDHRDLYTGDFRAAGKEGYRWDLEIQTPIQDLIALKFDGIEDLPAEFEVRLLDPALNIVQDLRKNPLFQVYNHRQLQIHSLSLLVGTSNYIENSLSGISMNVSRYDLLDNYPNPFNLSTTIPFALPSPAKVSLEIFNLLGEKVAVILNDQHYEGGIHKVDWDGRNLQGQVVASGIYVYHLNTGTFIKSKKMLLVK